MGSSKSKNLEPDNDARKQFEEASKSFDQSVETVKSLVEEAKNVESLSQYLVVVDKFAAYFDTGSECKKFAKTAEQSLSKVIKFEAMLDEHEIRQIVSLERIQAARKIYYKFWDLRGKTIKIVQTLSENVRLSLLSLRGIDRELQNGKNRNTEKMAKYIQNLTNWFKESQQTQNLGDEWNKLWKEASDEHDLWEDAINKSGIPPTKLVMTTGVLVAFSLIAVGVVAVLAPHCVVALAIVYGCYFACTTTFSISYFWYRLKLRQKSNEAFTTITNSAKQISDIMKSLAADSHQIETTMIQPLLILDRDQKADFNVISLALDYEDIEECKKTIPSLQKKFEDFGKKCDEVVATLSNTCE